VMTYDGRGKSSGVSLVLRIPRSDHLRTVMFPFMTSGSGSSAG
jgi:hypothetical protein